MAPTIRRRRRRADAGTRAGSLARAGIARAVGRANVAATAAPPRVDRIGTGVMPAVVIGLVLAAAVLAFVAQNTDQIELTWLLFDFDTTPGVVMLVSLFLGVLASVIVGVIVRRNRRIRLNEKEELARLRAGTPPHHARLRKPMTNAFSKSNVETMRAFVLARLQQLFETAETAPRDRVHRGDRPAAHPRQRHHETDGGARGTPCQPARLGELHCHGARFA